MTAADTILADLLASGIEPALTPDGTGIVVPAGRLTATQRAAVKAHKPELIEFLLEAQKTTAYLLQAAMAACDHWNDGPEAREAMRRDVEATPAHLRGDLLEHFKREYGGGHEI